MDIDDSDSENIVIQNDGDGGGNIGAKTAGSGGKRSDPDSAYTPDPSAEKAGRERTTLIHMPSKVAFCALLSCVRTRRLPTLKY